MPKDRDHKVKRLKKPLHEFDDQLKEQKRVLKKLKDKLSTKKSNN